MNDDSKAGCVGILAIIAYIGIIVGCGFLSWNWIDPDDFGTGLLFVLVWGLLSALGVRLAMFLVALISEVFN